jgi:hypothetical protein
MNETNSVMRFIIPVLLIMALTGCFKRYEGDVNAPCTDSCTTFAISVASGLNSATPLKGAKVELGWKRPATPFGDPGRLIAKGKTAANGSIQFSFKAEPEGLQSGQFYVAVRNGQDFFYQENGYYDISRFDTTVNARVHVPSKATLKLVFKNFQPTSLEDLFDVWPSFNTYGSMEYPIELKNQAGQFSNSYFSGDRPAFTREELTGTTAGDQYTYFKILIKKNGVRTDAWDSIYIAKGQTGTYEIEY